jgi:AraC-like DNA-binding protein
MTVKEAGEKWGLGSRIVTLYCAEGRINGAVKKGNLWLVPANASRPTDRRLKKILIQKEKETAIYKDTYALQEQTLDSSFEDKELFMEIIKHFPYPMFICEADGTMVFANEAFMKFVKVSEHEKIYRKHNVLQHPDLERWGIKEFILPAYQGKIVQIYDVKVPVQELIEKFGGNKELVSESLFHNITCFPIFNDNNQLLYVVSVFITSRSYKDKEEIIKGKEYIEDHWQKEFDIDKMAGAVNLSRYHYMRLFKKDTGMTPFDYYQDVKIGKIKEKLCDKNLSVTQAFTDCGVDYSGNYLRIFKEKVGMTPSQYRMSMTQK